MAKDVLISAPRNKDFVDHRKDRIPWTEQRAKELSNRMMRRSNETNRGNTKSFKTRSDNR